MANFEIRRDGDSATLSPGGDVVASSVPELRPAMRDLVRSGVSDMVLDLGRTEMLDSTGIGLLLSAYNSVSQAGGKFSVVEASGEILELLRAMRVHQHFPVAGRSGSQ
ncbi:MAG TPA: STAS domain-containing protein [Bryobacteraceae bacterium]|nr:STAS domain-containing protein [Bryobacteraceae bacterium]